MKTTTTLENTMRKRTLIVTTAAMSLIALPLIGIAQDDAATQPATQPETKAAETEAPDVSYSIGFEIGTGIAAQFSQLGVQLDNKAVMEGFEAAMTGQNPKITPEEMAAISQAFQQRLMAQAMMKMQAEGQANATAGEEFLVENAKNDGVKTTQSGLQYKVINEGEGDSPVATDTVKVNYEGKLLDGTVFDSSYDRGQPVEFPLNQVIPGWTEGLQLMKPGAKYELFIPSDLAYGPQGGGGGRIPPNSTLMFTVELLEIK